MAEFFFVLTLNLKHAACTVQGLDWACPGTVGLLRAALMTGADLAGATKPWPIQKEVGGSHTNIKLLDGQRQSWALATTVADSVTMY